MVSTKKLPMDEELSLSLSLCLSGCRNIYNTYMATYTSFPFPQPKQQPYNSLSRSSLFTT